MVTGYVTKEESTGKYYYTLELGKDANGKRIRKKKRGFKKEKYARAALNEAIAASLNEEKHQPQLSKQQNMLLEDFLKFWLENYAKTNTRPRTFDGYSKIVHKQLIPALGKIAVNELTSLDL